MPITYIAKDFTEGAGSLYQKYLFSSNSATDLLPYNERISQIILTSKGGRIHFGNFYLGKPLLTNYLGRYEGQAGGSGKPLRNTF